MVKRNRMKRTGSIKKKKRMKTAEMKSIIKPTETITFKTSPAQRYVLSRHPFTQNTNVRSLTQLKKMRIEWSKKIKDVDKEIENLPFYKKNRKLADEHYKERSKYRELANKEQLKAHRKFFTFDSVWDSYYRRKESMWVKRNVETALKKKFPDATDEEIKKIAFELADTYRDKETKYWEYAKSQKLHDKEWHRTLDITRTTENKIKEKRLGDYWWKKPNVYQLKELEKGIQDRNELRKMYNKFKARNKKAEKEEEYRRRISAITPEKIKESYKEIVGE